MSENPRRLSVGITTRNRAASLLRAVESIRLIAHLSPEILVFDDQSDVPVAETLSGHPGVRIIRDRAIPSYIAGRNALVAMASSPFVLLLDDDAALIDARGIEQALSILESDPRVAAIGFAQAEANGTPWPETMQPARGRAPRYIAAYIGFAHLVRRSTFLELGGYRESFVFYGEEKEYCLRLLDDGYHVVYLPDALVMHAQDASGRSQQRYLRYVTRNDCLNAIYNEPLRRLVWLLPARLGLYFRMRRRWGVHDPAGWRWIIGEVAANTRAALRVRKPVSRRTLAAWRRLRDADAPYTAPVPGS